MYSPSLEETMDLQMMRLCRCCSHSQLKASCMRYKTAKVAGIEVSPHNVCIHYAHTTVYMCALRTHSHVTLSCTYTVHCRRAHAWLQARKLEQLSLRVYLHCEDRRNFIFWHDQQVRAGASLTHSLTLNPIPFIHVMLGMFLDETGDVDGNGGDAGVDGDGDDDGVGGDDGGGVGGVGGDVMVVVEVVVAIVMVVVWVVMVC